MSLDYKSHAQVLAHTLLKMKHALGKFKLATATIVENEKEEDPRDALIRQLRAELAEKDRLIEEMKRNIN